MPSKFYEFMRDRYSAYPVMLGSERIVPGRLLDAEWSSGHFLSLGRDRHPEFVRHRNPMDSFGFPARRFAGNYLAVRFSSQGLAAP